MGRVQTPTLAMLVERELAIRSFRPGRLPGGRRHVLARGGQANEYEGTWFRPGKETLRRRFATAGRWMKKPNRSSSGRAPGEAAHRID